MSQPYRLNPPPAERLISDKSKRHYANIIKMLLTRTRHINERGFEVDANPAQIVQYLFAHRHEYRPRTFLKYRTALVWWLATLEVDEHVASAWERLHEPLPLDGYKGRTPDTEATLYSRRSERSRTVSRARLQKVFDELTHRTANARTIVQRTRASEMQYWIRAGLATGLRPIEWQQAFWSDKGKGELSVITAKRKFDNYALPSISHLSDQGKESLRTVRIQDPQDIVWVDLHLKSVQKHMSENESFESLYHKSRTYLKALCQQVFTKKSDHFTLYTLRGQFAANRKISGEPMEDISEQMGCSVPHVQGAYGKKINGHRHLRGSMREKDQQAHESKRAPNQPAAPRAPAAPPPPSVRLNNK